MKILVALLMWPFIVLGFMWTIASAGFCGGQEIFAKWWLQQ